MEETFLYTCDVSLGWYYHSTVLFSVLSDNDITPPKGSVPIAPYKR